MHAIPSSDLPADLPHNLPPGLPSGLRRRPIIGILRDCPLRHVEAIAAVAVQGGVDVLEVTLDSERPLDQISLIRDAHPTAEVGVGSVRSAQDVAPAVSAGATFVVSPIVDARVIAAASDLGVPSLPGAATPTEIEQAVRHGATAVKVFPAAQLGGPAYLRAVLAPLGSPPLVPTGGVDAATAPEYLQAGAVAVALGGSLFPPRAMEVGDTATIERLVRDLARAIP